MRITNKYGLPEAVVKAVTSKESHRQADFSVTQLMKGSTEIALEMIHKDELEIDASDLFNALLGTSVHRILQEEETEGVLNEHFMKVRSYAGFTVSGIADVIDTVSRRIEDYKSCSVWKIRMKDYSDWREQLKCYLYMWHEETGDLYTDGRIVAMIKDFSPAEAERDYEYPRAPIVTVSFEYTEQEILSVGDTWTYKIIDVLQKLVAEDKGCCSEAERWARPSKWALMKEGRKTAIKLYDTEAEAVEAQGEQKGYYVEHRKGESTKCLRYCTVGKCGFCPFRDSEVSK